MIFSIGTSVLEACVLALLMQGDSYGYKITQDLKESVHISDSTLYPVLKKLLNAGLLSSYNVEFDGRNRRYYTVTAAGKDQHEKHVAEWQSYKKMFDELFT